MTTFTRNKGLPRRPCRYQGREFTSLNALVRVHSNLWWERVYELINRGEIELLEAPAQRLPATSAERIIRAADEIKAISRAQVEENAQDGTRVELVKRRYALIKAIGYHWRRHGRGVLEGR